MGCSSQPMYIANGEIPAEANAKVVVLLEQDAIDLQTFYGGGGLIAEFEFAADKNDTNDNLEKLKQVLHTDYSSEFQALFMSTDYNVSWLGNLSTKTYVDPEKFVIEKAIENADSDILILVKPRYFLSPYMDMVETRTSIEFYRHSLNPFYSTTSITQSKIVDIPNIKKPNFYHGLAFLGPDDEDLESAINYWVNENLDGLAEIISTEISEAVRLVGVAIDEAGDLVEHERDYSKIPHENLAGNYSSFELDGYYLKKYYTNTRVVLRRMSQPYQYPAHAYNAVFSIPKEQNLQNIGNRSE
jgi:hypothetical protein